MIFTITLFYCCHYHHIICALNTSVLHVYYTVPYIAAGNWWNFPLWLPSKRWKLTPNWGVIVDRCQLVLGIVKSLRVTKFVHDQHTHSHNENILSKMHRNILLKDDNGNMIIVVPSYMWLLWHSIEIICAQFYIFL